MSTTPILDNFQEINKPVTKVQVQRTLLRIELGLWALCGLEFLFWKYVTRSFLVEIPVYPYRLLLCFSALVLFYLVFPEWLFGSKGWGRHVLSHISGLYIAAGVFFSFMHIDHVFYDIPLADEGSLEMCMAVLDLYPIFLIVFGFIFIMWKDSPRGRGFYWAALARLGLAVVLLAFSIWVVKN